MICQISHWQSLSWWSSFVFQCRMRYKIMWERRSFYVSYTIFYERFILLNKDIIVLFLTGQLWGCYDTCLALFLLRYALVILVFWNANLCLACDGFSYCTFPKFNLSLLRDIYIYFSFLKCNEMSFVIHFVLQRLFCFVFFFLCFFASFSKN